MTLRRALLAVFLASAATALAETSITRGPYLQIAHQSGVTVVWRTNGAMDQPRWETHAGRLHDMNRAWFQSQPLTDFIIGHALSGAAGN
jgi:hypothetical protein